MEARERREKSISTTMDTSRVSMDGRFISTNRYNQYDLNTRGLAPRVSTVERIVNYGFKNCNSTNWANSKSLRNYRAKISNIDNKTYVYFDVYDDFNEVCLFTYVECVSDRRKYEFIV